MSHSTGDAAKNLNDLVASSMRRAGVPISMSRPDFSLSEEFGKPGALAKSFCLKANSFFSQGRILVVSSDSSTSAHVAGRMIYGIARGLVLSRVSCRVTPLSVIVNSMMSSREGGAALGELEELDALIIPDFYSVNRPAPFTPEIMSRVEGWIFSQVTRAGQGMVLLSEALALHQCDWWPRWMLSSLEDRATVLTVTEDGREGELSL